MDFFKLLVSVIFVSLLLSACADHDDELQDGCIELARNTGWNTENFKTDFTIQFPDNYEGNGMVGFEGNTFSKIREDKKIEFEYFFCTGTFCYDFGSALEEPIPSSIVVKDKNRNKVTLDSREEFCSDGNIIGYLYFIKAESATGKYYMKRDSVFLEGLSIYFDNTEIQEVESIVKTIVEK